MHGADLNLNLMYRPEAHRHGMYGTAAAVEMLQHHQQDQPAPSWTGGPPPFSVPAFPSFMPVPAGATEALLPTGQPSIDYSSTNAALAAMDVSAAASASAVAAAMELSTVPSFQVPYKIQPVSNCPCEWTRRTGYHQISQACWPSFL